MKKQPLVNYTIIRRDSWGQYDRGIEIRAAVRGLPLIRRVRPYRRAEGPMLETAWRRQARMALHPVAGIRWTPEIARAFEQWAGEAPGAPAPPNVVVDWWWRDFWAYCWIAQGADR